MLRVTVLAGGVGGARFAAGLRDLLGRRAVTVIGNTGDDITLHGLRVCPDLDSVMYTLGGVASAERGWGRAGETFVVRAELTGYASPDAWFGLGDRDLATHLVRSQLLAQGVPLSAVTARLCERWRPGIRLLPMTDDPVHTEVLLESGDSVHFQRWWVGMRAAEPATGFAFDGCAEARPAPGVLEAIADCNVLLLAPSNPVVSIGPILAIPGIAAAVRDGPAPVVGVAPIIGGRPVRGMADACLPAIGVATDAAAVARHYGARRFGGLLDGWLVDDVDAACTERLSDDGIRSRALPLLMRDRLSTMRIAGAAMELAGCTP